MKLDPESDPMLLVGLAIFFGGFMFLAIMFVCWAGIGMYP